MGPLMQSLQKLGEVGGEVPRSTRRDSRDMGRALMVSTNQDILALDFALR